MIGAGSKGKANAGTATAPYHHGDLRAHLLVAAESILERDGIEGLTLRAAAREAGVSHAAPKNHFGDLRGLLSELAAVGFARFNAAMEDAMAGAAAGAGDAANPERMFALGRAYVRFARANPGLFVLMFRAERLDYARPALRDASALAFARFSGATGAPLPNEDATLPRLALPQAARLVSSWAFVHGLAMLLIDGRLKPIIDRLPPGTDEQTLLAAMFDPPDARR